jgi:hypothetical protein
MKLDAVKETRSLMTFLFLYNTVDLLCNTLMHNAEFPKL